MNIQANIYIIILTLLAPVYSAHAAQVTFGDHETAIPIMNEAATTDDKKYLWNQYPGGGIGNATIINTDSAINEMSLKIAITSGQLYLQFYPHNGVEWEFMSEVITNRLGLNWQTDYFNRMEFYILAPPNVEIVTHDLFNLSIGTYVRAKNGNRDSAESGGYHFYHRFHIPYTGEWQKVVFDLHPHHNRGDSGDLEQGNREYPAGDVNFNYFDSLTRFYVAMKTETPTVGTTDFLVDGFKLYREENIENEEQVYSVSGVYDKSKGKLIVTWQRNKDENDVDHEVRYSFLNIHDTGWDNVPVANRDGPFDTGGYNGYNNVYWEKSGIEIGANDFIYVAIKPENSALFKQIRVPLTIKGRTIIPPVPPTGLSIN